MISWFSKSVKLEGESVSATEKPIIKSKLKRNREIKIAGLTCCLLGVVCFFLLHKLHNIHPFILSIHTEIWTQGKTQPIHACRQGFYLRAFTYACKKTEKKLFCMQNRQVTPNLHREETTIFFCEGGREAFWKICWVAAKHLLFPRWGRNSWCTARAQGHNRVDTRGTVRLCWDLDWVVNIIYVKYITVTYYIQWIHFCYSILCETDRFLFWCSKKHFWRLLKKSERKDQLIISEILFRAQSCKLLLSWKHHHLLQKSRGFL